VKAETKEEATPLKQEEPVHSGIKVHVKEKSQSKLGPGRTRPVGY